MDRTQQNKRGKMEKRKRKQILKHVCGEMIAFSLHG